MDYLVEPFFVKAFIRKERRERLLYELTTPSKRYNGVSRFCHQSEEFLDPQKILMQGEDLDRRPEFKQFIKKHDETCYILSPDSFLDEQFMSLKEAVDSAVMCMDAVVIVGNTFAIVFGEVMKGGRGKYLLTVSNKETI